MNMKAILTDDTAVDCAGFKALESGVVLFADDRRREAIGFLPTARLRYILPAPEEETPPEGDQDVAAAEASTEAEAPDDAIDADAEESAESAEEESADVTRQLTAFATDGTEIACHGLKALESGVVLFADAERTDVAGFLPMAQLELVLADDALATTEAEAAVDDRFVDAETLVSEEETDERTTGSETGTFEAVDVEEGEAPADAGEEGVEGDDTASFDADEADDSTDVVEVVDLAEEEELTRLAGLGETYAERLRAHGIVSVSDLRATTVDELAEAADVPTGRAERWKSQVE